MQTRVRSWSAPETFYGSAYDASAHRTLTVASSNSKRSRVQDGEKEERLDINWSFGFLGHLACFLNRQAELICRLSAVRRDSGMNDNSENARGKK